MKSTVQYFYKDDLIFGHKDGLGYAFALADKGDEDKINANRKTVTHWCICDRDLLYSLHRFLTHAMLDMDKKDKTKRRFYWVVCVDDKFSISQEKHFDADEVHAFYSKLYPESKVIISSRIEASEEEVNEL